MSHRRGWNLPTCSPPYSIGTEVRKAISITRSRASHITHPNHSPTSPTPGCAPRKKCPILYFMTRTTQLLRNLSTLLFAFCSQLTCRQHQKLSFVPARLREVIAFTKNGLDRRRALPLKDLGVLTMLDVSHPCKLRRSRERQPYAGHLHRNYRYTDRGFQRNFGRHISISKFKSPVLSELIKYCIRFVSFSCSSEPPKPDSYFASTSISLCNLDQSLFPGVLYLSSSGSTLIYFGQISLALFFIPRSSLDVFWFFPTPSRHSGHAGVRPTDFFHDY